ncbi:MAG: HU family DNA-binding protein, partial [Caulobacterales bacterium]
MNKAELATAIADKAGITRAQASDAIDTFVDSIVAAGKKGET